MPVKLLFDDRSRKLLNEIGYVGDLKEVEARIRPHSVYEFLQEIDPNLYISEDMGPSNGYSGVYSVGVRGIKVCDSQSAEQGKINIKRHKTAKRKDGDMLAENIFEAIENGLVPDMDVVREELRKVFDSGDSESTRGYTGQERSGQNLESYQGEVSGRMPYKVKINFDRNARKALKSAGRKRVGGMRLLVSDESRVPHILKGIHPKLRISAVKGPFSIYEKRYFVTASIESK